MNLSVDRPRLYSAFNKARQDLLSLRLPEGRWGGEVTGSAFSTAAAICALVLSEQYGSMESHGRHSENLYDSDSVFQGDLCELIMESLHWLAKAQNADGGWGDSSQSKSALSTTMLVTAAFRLTALPTKDAYLLDRAEQFIHEQGGVRGLKRQSKEDHSFIAPLLACCAMAGFVPWRQVPALPFERTSLPITWLGRARLPVLSFALPMLIAVGQARFYHAPSWNPLVRMWRKKTKESSLELLESMQPESGGFMESPAMTAFVVMSLSSIGLSEHSIVRQGVEFLLSNVKENGSWPIESNFAVRSTALASKALFSVEPGLSVNGSEDAPNSSAELIKDQRAIETLLQGQFTETHPITFAQPGGWSWSTQPSGAPNTMDTSRVLLALATSRSRATSAQTMGIERAAKIGLRWLLEMQNEDGGWPTFVREWKHLKHDGSGCEITALAMQALHTWNVILHGAANPSIDLKHDVELSEKLENEVASMQQEFVECPMPISTPKKTCKNLKAEIESALGEGLAYLESTQRRNGSWVPLWFRNQHNPEEENPVVGTAQVLTMLSSLGSWDSPMARRGLEWLLSVQHASGGWGAVDAVERKYIGKQDKNPEIPVCSVEETSLAVAALSSIERKNREVSEAVQLGLAWLVDSVESGRSVESSPIGFYLTKLWYHERTFSKVLLVSVLGESIKFETKDAEEKRKEEVVKH